MTTEAWLAFLLGTWVPPFVYVALKLMRSWSSSRTYARESQERLAGTLARVEGILNTRERRHRGRP